MASLRILLLVYLVSYHGFADRIVRQAPTTPLPDENESVDASCEEDQDDEEAMRLIERGRLAAEFFPDTLPRAQVRRILTRALELLDKPSAKRQCRRYENIDQAAKNTLRFLTGDPGVGSSTDETSRSASDRSQSPEVCQADIVIEGTRRIITPQVMQNIINLYEKGQSEKSIQGKYKWYRRNYLPRFREYLRSGGTNDLKAKQIDEYVRNQTEQAINDRIPVHEFTMRNWALERADQLGADNFRASYKWLHHFKKRNSYTSRKVTKYVSRAEENQQDSIELSRDRFLSSYQSIRQLFPFHRILNVDQSNFNYEISNLRSIARKGERDHILRVDSMNKNTHSYTSQPMIARDGTLAGKLLLCLQEEGDRFGPRVETRVRQLETELGNIVITCSRSGKMSSRLTEFWINEILVAEMNRTAMEPHVEIDLSDTEEYDSQETEIAGPSWASNPVSELTEEQKRILEIREAARNATRLPNLLLLSDSWGGHSSNSLATQLLERGIFQLQIPKHTTGELQPLDVNFFRQYKKFVKRITEASIYESSIANITDRYGIINMHSLIWDQFNSSSYRDMIRYAWRHTDPGFSIDELEQGTPPAMVDDIQFDFHRHQTCSVDRCTAKAFTRCSHCGRHLCLHHFLQRVCFHHHDHEPEMIHNVTSTPRPDSDEDRGSGGAAAAIITAGVVGVGGGMLASGAVSSIISGSISSSISSPSGSKDQEIPLLSVHEIRPSSVIVQLPDPPQSMD